MSVRPARDGGGVTGMRARRLPRPGVRSARCRGGEARIARAARDLGAAAGVLGPGPPHRVLPAEPARPGLPVAAEDALTGEGAPQRAAQHARQHDASAVVQPEHGVGPLPQQITDLRVADGVDDPAGFGDDARHRLGQLVVDGPAGSGEVQPVHLVVRHVQALAHGPRERGLARARDTHHQDPLHVPNPTAALGGGVCVVVSRCRAGRRPGRGAGRGCRGGSGSPRRSAGP